VIERLFDSICGPVEAPSTRMEAEERPTKIRRLDDDVGSDQDGGETRNAESTDAVDEIQAPEQTAAHEEPASSLANLDGDESTRAISKNEQKRIRKQEAWEAGRDYRKAKRKEKTQERKARKRAERLEQLQNEREERVLTELQQGPIPKQKPPPPPRQRHVRLPVTFVVDCGFDDLMVDKERISLGSQLTRVYSDNYKAPYQAHLIVSSWGGKLKGRFDTVLGGSHRKWRDVLFMEEDFVDAAKVAREAMVGKNGGKLLAAFGKYATAGPTGAPQNQGDLLPIPEPPARTGSSEPEDSAAAGAEAHSQDFDDTGEEHDASTTDITLSSQKSEVIYLTSDSPNTLDELKPYHTYVVGGLVDKNRHKGICYKTACDKGVKTAKLPIGQYMEMQSRFVLATNHVIEIMLRWLDCGDWGEAFIQVIPKRKGGRLRGNNPDSIDGQDKFVSEEEDQEPNNAQELVSGGDPINKVTESGTGELTIH